MSVVEAAPETMESKQGLRLLIVLPALLVFLFLTFPGGYLPLRSGLDPSWHYALNFLPNSGLQYGTDVTFTYGPLGFLLYPMDIGANLVTAAGFRLLVHLLFGLAIAYAALRISGILPVLLFMGAYLYSVLLGLHYESHLVIVGAVWAATAVCHGRAGLLTLPCLSVLAGICLFIKPTLAVSLISMLGLAELARLMSGHTRFYTIFPRSLLPLMLVSAVLWLYFFGAWTPFQAWLLMTLEYMRYNAVAMALEGPRSELIAGAVCVLAFICASVVLMGMRSDVSVAAIILFPTLFALFKHGFERQDGHVLFFFAPYVGLVGTLILVSRRFNDLAFACLLFFCAVLLATPVVSARNALYYAGAIDLLSGKQGFANVKAMANLTETRRILAGKSAENASGLRLPGPWLELIEENSGTMDVLPWEIAYCPANGIPWRPNPSVQTYAAYTAYLDKRLAQHFGGETAPLFLLLKWEGFDERCLPFDVPRTWHGLLRNYRLVDVETDTKLLLLVRRAIPLSMKPLPSNEQTIRFDQWIDLSTHEDVLLAAFQLKLTPEGQAMKTLLRIPPLFIEFELAGGATERRRIVPENAANGLVVNYPPLELFDAVRAFSELPPRSAARFRITGPGARYYDQEIPMTLTRVQTVARSRSQLARAQDMSSQRW